MTHLLFRTARRLSVTRDRIGDPPMWGRPVDVLELKDGSLLVSDDYNGILYRISYKK